MKSSLKKSTFIITIIILAVSLAIAVTAITYAVWVQTIYATKELSVPIDEYNPSEKYIVFHGINNNGELVESSPTAYAVVGYEGSVAELIIPSTHNSLPVTKICADPDQIDKRLAGNEHITSVRIPASVTTIAAGAFQYMPYLNTVVFDLAIPTELDPNPTTPTINIGDYAFAGCVSLTTFTCPRTVSGDSAKYLLGTSV